jgi:hypothetical protein
VPRGDGRLFGELLQGRRLLEHVVPDGDEPAVDVGAELDPLDRRRAMADDGELLLARQHALHRPAHDA